MKTLRGSAGVSILLFSLIHAHPAVAVSIRPNKPTDATVCDLGPNTTSYLAKLVFVSADARPEDQLEVLYRAGASFVASHCKDGQILVLHGESARRLEASALEKIAASSCAVANIARTDVPYVSNLSKTLPGFELRCPISKQAQLSAEMDGMDRAESLETFIKRTATRR